LQTKVQENPNNLNLKIQLAEIFADQEQFSQAIEILEKSLDPTQENSKQILADLYYKSGKKNFSQENKQQGLKELKHSIALIPHHLEANLLLGALALVNEDWETARQHFLVIQQNFPQEERGHYGLSLIELGKGIAAQSKGDYTQAIQAWLQYVQTTPDKEEKKRIQSMVENLQKNQHELEKKERAKKYWIQGLKNMEKKKWDSALSFFSLALNMKPDFPDAQFYWYFAKGMAAFEKKDWKEASLALQQAIALKKDIADIYCTLGQIALEEKNQSQKSKETQEKCKQAENFFLQALKINPNLADIYFVMGYEIYYLDGDYDLAKIYLQSYLSKSPQGKFANKAQSVVETISLMQTK
jgi:tetratricopeptide (TPR) repeat protein